MSRPTCAACGKPLPLFKDRSRQENRETYSRSKRAQPAPPLTADGLPPTRGKLGDNLVCKLHCGWLLAIRLVAADPGVLSALLANAYSPAELANKASEERRQKSRIRRRARKKEKITVPLDFDVIDAD